MEPSSCPHNTEYECFTCADNRHRNEHPDIVEGCLSCKLQTIQVSQRVRPPSRVNAPPHGGHNSWENGVPTDDRGMPFLGKGGQPIGVKEYSDRRTEIEGWRARLRQDSSVFSEQE